MTRLVKFANNAVSRLAANILSGATSLSLTPGDGAKFPTLTGSQFFMATLVKSDGTTEVIKVTGRATDTLTIVRAAEAVGGVQTSYGFTAGDRVEQRLTADALVNELDRIEAAAITSALNKTANYTITAADVTSLVRVNSGTGNIVIGLPEISTLAEDFDVIVAKVTSDTNTVTIARTGSTDLINGATSYTIYNQYQSAWLIADRSTNTWTVISSGISAVNTAVDAGTGDGVATTVTLSGDPGSKNNVAFFVGGVYQQKATFSLSGTTLTPGATIASGVTWEAVWSAPLTIGTPSDGTVTTIKLAASAVTTAKIADANVTPAKLAGSVDFSFYGITVGRGAGAVSTNTAVGASALSSGSQSGTQIVAFGTNALQANTSGGFNSAVGVNCLYSNTTGQYNTAFGNSSLFSNTTGIHNTAFGYQALYSNTDQSYQVALGYQALYSCTTGNSNTMIGRQAGYSITSGTSNTFLGGRSNSSGNTCGYAVTTGSYNVIIGNYTGNNGGLDIRTANNYIVLSDGDGNPRGVFDGSGNYIVGTTSNPNTSRLYVRYDGVTTQPIINSATTTTASTSWNHFVGQSGNGSSVTTNNIFILGNGNIQNANNSYGAISDAKLKDIIGPAKSQWDKFKRYEFVNYTLKSDESKTKLLGLVAQQAETVSPGVIEETPDRDAEGNDLGTVTKGVKYSIVTMQAEVVLQEAQVRIEQLETLIADLTTRLAAAGI